MIKLIASPSFKYSYLHYILTLFYLPVTAAGKIKKRKKTQAWLEASVATS